MRVKIENYFAILVIVLLLPSTSVSEIRERIDKFENSTLVESFFENISPWRLVSLQNINGKVSLFLSRLESEQMFFSHVAQINIDGRRYISPIENPCSSIINSNLFLISGQINIDNLTNELSVGKEVVIKVYFTNKPSLKWKVPENVLKEWQSVITR